mmetsp:Transcript_45674/g.76083  ORF Transcript_45674/g.76083 Transcript_45674/m.76083 type:complete len:239 (+) Transcript_45674:74-790(+)
MEGFGEEVILAGGLILVFSIGLVTFEWLLKRRRSASIHVEEENYVEDFKREEKLSEGKGREEKLNREDAFFDEKKEEIFCSICLDAAQRPVETNCGHTYCSDCITGYWQHRNCQIPCPCCRTMVSILLPIDPSDDGTEHASAYNRRYSGVPRSFLEHIYDTPMLLRHLFNRVMDGSGILWLVRGRQIFVLVGAVLYVLSPLDIIPESFFGTFGYIDDVLALFLGVCYIAFIFRQIYVN